MPSNPVTPPHLVYLMGRFPDVVAQLANLDQAGAPWQQVATRILLADHELVRHLAAIGRGVTIEELKLGTFANVIGALGCLHATGASAHGPELVQIFGERLGMGAVPPRPHLRLVAENDA